MNSREQRGLIIAAMTKLTRGKDGWIVPSQSGDGTAYVVDPVGMKCTCPDHLQWGHKCKHIHAVEITIKREIAPDGTVTETASITFTEKRVYRQNWEAYNEAQRVEKSRFQVLLHELCRGVEEPEEKNGKRGRKPHTYADSMFAMVFKVYCGFSTRRFSTDLAEAHAKGYTSKLIPGMKVNQFHDNEVFTPILQNLIVQSSLPLRAVEKDFAIDSTGFSGCRFDRWFEEKHGGEMVKKSEHTWCKAHLACGVKTNVVTAAIVLEKDSADCPQFTALTKTTLAGFKIEEMSADKAYLSGENVEAIFAAGGTPFIAPKVNTTGGIGGLFAKMFHYFLFRREEFLAHYHKRSNVESTISSLKRKFGDSVRSKNDVAMKNEVLSKIVAHNLCVLIQEQHELGIEPVFWRDDQTEELPISEAVEPNEPNCYSLVPVGGHLVK
jgi:transposase